jgi:hypothetical protein
MQKGVSPVMPSARLWPYLERRIWLMVLYFYAIYLLYRPGALCAGIHAIIILMLPLVLPRQRDRRAQFHPVTTRQKRLAMRTQPFSLPEFMLFSVASKAV